ncbi:MAG TPA: PD-(D/E)XK nuclease family protein [Anaerolineales bacterium]|nr:PD-(D/E)XK nuclease family protein [Anaerolineales bacterium]
MKSEFMPSDMLVSAKSLGEPALPDFCPRCYWIKLRLENKLPFQIFPGIFSSIDAYTKRVVHGWFDQYAAAPPWLEALGPLTGYRQPPHYTRFKVQEPETGLILRGTPDAVYIRPDGSHLIADYKTSRYTNHQDRLLPMYIAQLNAYAYLGERCGLAPVSALALIYTEPVTHEEAATDQQNYRQDGFSMGFSAHIVPVELNPDLVRTLLRQVRLILDLPEPPQGLEGCKDCSYTANLVALLSEE